MCTMLIFRSEHFTQHFQTPIRQVNLSVNALDNNIMATPAEYDSPVLTEDTASPEVGLGPENEATNSAALKKGKQKVARPPNAFIIYRKAWHSTVVAANPGVHNNAICKQIQFNFYRALANFIQLASLARSGRMKARTSKTSSIARRLRPSASTRLPTQAGNTSPASRPRRRSA